MADVKIKKKNVQVASGGAESSLDVWSVFFLLGGIVSAAALLWYSGEIGRDLSGYYDNGWGQKGFDLTYVILSFYALLSGIFTKVLLSGASDVIRLLKKQCNIPYAGNITGDIEIFQSSVYVCNACDTVVNYKQNTCSNCEEQLVF